MTRNKDDTTVEISCKSCGSKTKKSVGWMKDHGEFECGCGTMVTVDPNEFNKELMNTESDLDGSQGLLKKLGR
jgi:hypothetical protein